jgi:SNF2 family DNA or RNA helicase
MPLSGQPLVISNIKDNYRHGTVGDFLRAKIRDGAALSFVSAYFTIYAFGALEEQLNPIHDLRFLFGEPRFVKAVDPDRDDGKSFKITDQGLELVNQLQQKPLARRCAAWIADKVDIRSVKQANFLHGKLYHIAYDKVEDAIVGSSNFTVRGLGLGPGGNNIELNLEVDSTRDRRELKAWFDEIWNDADLVEDVKQAVLLYLEQMYRNHAPEFIYYKTLFHLFEQFLAEQGRSLLLDERSQIVDTDIWRALFEFQKDGVKGAINKIQTHDGCILADSVGLGKTFEALAIIKYFELRNYRVLVLCPKKLRENWTVYQAYNNSELNPFVRDRFSYTVLSHTDLSREGGRSGDIDLATINWGNYDLVVIDESHNFRNNTRGRRDETGQVIRQSRYERLMADIIQSGVKTQVLMLSATPVNNSLSDLRNQISFITEGKDDAFRESIGIASLTDTLNVAQRTFSDWAKRTGDRKTGELLEKLGSGFFKLLDELTIARSRKHIQRYYRDSVAQLGGFPERLRPVAVYPQIDLRDRFMSYDLLNDEISHYQLSLFNPSRYVLPIYMPLYERKSGFVAFTQQRREFYLIGMMKVGFLKRLESSVHSFAITLDRTVRKIETLEQRIERFKRLRDENPTLDFGDLEVEVGEDDELREAFQVGEKLVFQMAHLDVDAWLADLHRDKEQLALLQSSAESITVERDAKLAKLKSLIEGKVRQPTTDKQGRPNRKVLVFTAFADTATYLYSALRDWARDDLGIHIALVTGGATENKTTFGNNEFNHILTNFSPVSKKRRLIKPMRQDGEIDLLIATDCISEGQNLQDCDYLVNYDIHWNPVRVIQRFGRIDRIGSINPAVQLVNFWPTKDLDKYIALKSRVEARMALVDIAATNEDNLLRPDEIEDLIKDELKYRDRQLLRLKDEVLDLEDFTETVNLNDFTLDDFRMELSKYIESNRRLLEEAPLGLYTVVPADPAYPLIAPGVIYCLRQRGDAAGSEVINPLQPYYLVYIRTDGVVRFSFAQPKQILEIYRALCAEKTVPYEALCDLFDQETCGGASMECYNDLLQKAVRSIIGTFSKRSASHLLSGRGAVLVEQKAQAQETTDFDLITWLVIK